MISINFGAHDEHALPLRCQPDGLFRTPIQQAQCLLRFVKRVGNVDDTPATLPPILTTLLSDPLNLGVTKSQLRSHLQKQGIAESTVGGSVTDRICHADTAIRQRLRRDIS